MTSNEQEPEQESEQAREQEPEKETVDHFAWVSNKKLLFLGIPGSLSAILGLIYIIVVRICPHLLGSPLGTGETVASWFAFIIVAWISLAFVLPFIKLLPALFSKDPARMNDAVSGINGCGLFALGFAVAMVLVLYPLSLLIVGVRDSIGERVTAAEAGALFWSALGILVGGSIFIKKIMK